MNLLKRKLAFPALLLPVLFFSDALFATNNSEQTIRGVIIDQDSKTPVIGANIVILGSTPIKGSSTDIDGNFRIEKVPVGRVNLQVTYLGYETKTIPNVLVSSGKEVVLSLEIIESMVKLEDITVKAKRNKTEALNEMAIISANVVSVEETKRYAGTFNDPARMVSSLAGVTGDAEGSNDIVVRGNSPRGILWRLEGVEIPNPNHFANEGSSGGPINALNSAMLANSDFFSGAFAPEYGNAYSGVFDMRLRNGNNEKREYSFSAGALGIDFTAEGPYSKNSSASYLINYRYSSLGILDDLGIVDFFGVPRYQDISFKTVFPTKKAGTLSLFGLGGLSSIDQQAYADENEEYVNRKGQYFANIGVVGLNHTFQLNESSFLKNSVAISGTQSGDNYEIRGGDEQFYQAGKEDYIKTSIILSSCYNRKINSRNRIKAGVTYTDLGYNFYDESNYNGDDTISVNLDSKGRAGVLQSYFNWKYRMFEDLTIISGIHYLHFLYNNSISFEPRFGMEWRTKPGQSVSLGFGLHSKVESLATYQAQVYSENGEVSNPNRDLDLAKSMHVVLGFKQNLFDNIHFKTEIYYQHLYNVAVKNNGESPIVLNNLTGGWSNDDFVNKGKGKNYGLELTLERFYSNRFYFLLTGSLYESKFTALDGIERNSAFNGNYAANFLIGKEFPIGNKDKHRSIAVNAKIIFSGGSYYTPIDLEASIAAENDIYRYDQYLSKKSEDVFKADIGITYRRDRKRTTHEFKIDVQNVTNNQAIVNEYYDNEKQEIVSATQWTIFPNVIYTINF